MRQKKNLTGRKFGKLTVVGEAPRHPNDPAPYWRCKCQCGNETDVRAQHLTDGITKSCGNGYHRRKEQHYGWSGHKDISGTYLCQLRKGARRRSICFDISPEELWRQFLKQNKKCAFTGIVLTFNEAQRDSSGTASLDRIDSSKGYVKGNVQWVHKDVNYMKGDLSEEQFLNYCRLVCKEKFSHW